MHTYAKQAKSHEQVQPDATKLPTRQADAPVSVGLHGLLAHAGPAIRLRPLPQRADASDDTIQRAAAAGVQTASGSLPYAAQIQQSFGRHDVSGVAAHVGPEATESARAMNAAAYATGNHVVFAGAPDLRTAAHEAAHVVQQQVGVQLAGGVGRPGDMYEQHANAVADRVVAGLGAEGLLDRHVAAAEHQPAAGAVQHLPGIVQREITVANVDYNPVWDEYRHGFIKETDFYAGLRKFINATFDKQYNNQVAKMITSVRLNNFSRPDIPTLTDDIVQAVVTAYKTLNLTVSGSLRDALAAYVGPALVTAIRSDDQFDMNKTEDDGFQSLVLASMQHRLAEGVPLSRRKGTASTIPYAKLPADIKEEVTARLNEIRAERALWNPAAVRRVVRHGGFAHEIVARQRAKHYQGNHTNNAGWLPTVPAPIDQVEAMIDTIKAQASPSLKARLQAGGGLGTHARRDEFKGLFEAQLAGVTDAAVKMSVMAALCQAVSAYIEFSMTGGISRMIYEPVNNRVYVTAHYKWKEGLNPFFEVLGFPAV